MTITGGAHCIIPSKEKEIYFVLANLSFLAVGSLCNERLDFIVDVWIGRHNVSSFIFSEQSRVYEVRVDYVLS